MKGEMEERDVVRGEGLEEESFPGGGFPGWRSPPVGGEGTERKERRSHTAGMRVLRTCSEPLFRHCNESLPPTRTMTRHRCGPYHARNGAAAIGFKDEAEPRPKLPSPEKGNGSFCLNSLRQPGPTPRTAPHADPRL